MYNPMDMGNKRVIITGASSGLGKSAAEVLSRLGAQVVLVGRDLDRLEAALSCLEGKGHGVEVFDLHDTGSIPGWLKDLSKKYGSIDGLVHSAGVVNLRPLKILTLDDYSSLLRINLDAACFLAKGFRQRGVSNNPSSIVFLSSIASMIGVIGMAAYCTSKAGLIGLTKSLAMELVRDGIRVNCISPGYVRTEMTDQSEKAQTPEQIQAINNSQPLGIGAPEDVAHAIAYLLADTGKWITGTNLVVDGGATAHN